MVSETVVLFVEQFTVPVAYGEAWTTRENVQEIPPKVTAKFAVPVPEGVPVIVKVTPPLP